LIFKIQKTIENKRIMESPSKTANHEVVYSSETDERVNLLHKYNCEVNNWDFKPLKRACYGYDVLCIISDRFLKEKKPIENLSEKIHEWWADNYLFWAENHPEARGYRAPWKPLGDKERTTYAHTPYSLLPKDEQVKDDIIASALIKFFGPNLKSCAIDA
jgi:hypothetical protein